MTMMSEPDHPSGDIAADGVCMEKDISTTHSKLDIEDTGYKEAESDGFQGDLEVGEVSGMLYQY
jgi:hypothetical protein